MRAYLVSRSCLCAFGAVLLGTAALAVSAPASAQSGGVSCFLPPAKLPDSAVAKFMANPAGLLAAHPQGGPTLISAARALAGSDVRSVDALIEVAKNAAPELKADIAAGLANTAVSCVWTRPDIAQLIQEKIAAADDAPFSTAFLSVLRVGGTPALGGAGGPTRDIRRIGGAAVGPGGVEPGTSPQAGTEEKLKGRRGGGTSGTDNGISSAASGTDSASRPQSSSSGGSFNRSSRFNGNIRLFKPDVPVSPTMQ
jgi:hypothetical protein